MRSVTAPDGVELALHEHGGDGRPTLLCHATGFHGAVWEPMSAALGEGFARWAIDFRAHGASVVAPGTPLPWIAVRDDVLAVVDALGADPATLLGVGHSMGGAALLLAEQARPGTFAGLWLYEPVVPPPGAMPPSEGRNHLAEGARKRRPSFASHEAALANFASKSPLNVARADALHAYVRHGLVAGEDGEVHLACRPDDEARLYEGGAAHGAYDHLDEVQCAVVLACGGEPFGPASFATQVVERLPHGRLEVHPHLTHFGPLESPAELAGSVRSFAASL